MNFSGVHPRPMILMLLLAAFLLLPSMVMMGMFMDGVIYAAISRNLAEGIGSAWAPHFSEGLFPVFYEHPPLMFWLQSLFFRVLGDSWATERAYDLVVLLATAALMRALWLMLVRARGVESLAPYWWLPLLLWVVVPKWSWTYRNNLLESTLTVFCLLGVILVLAGLCSPSRRKAALFAAGAALAAAMAFLTKGPVGLFVLAAPVLLASALTRITSLEVPLHKSPWSFTGGQVISRVLLVLAILCGLFAVMALVLLAWPDAREMLTLYWNYQVLERASVSTPNFGILIELLKKLAPMLLVLACFRLWLWRDAKKTRSAAKGPAIAMLAIGLAASLPLVLGDLDSAHYLVPALPFFALGFGMFGAAMLQGADERTRKILKAPPGRLFILGSIVIGAAILAECLGRVGDVRREAEHHAFLGQVAEGIGRRQSVGVDGALENDWYLHSIAQRHYQISLLSQARCVKWRVSPARLPPPPDFANTNISSPRWILQRRVSVTNQQSDCN